MSAKINKVDFMSRDAKACAVDVSLNGQRYSVKVGDTATNLELLYILEEMKGGVISETFCRAGTRTSV